MAERSKKWDDEKIRKIMGTLLRVGVLSAASIAIFGGILFFVQHPNEMIDYSKFNSEPGKLRQVHFIIEEAFNFRGRAIIQLGLLLLIATPVARVLFSLFGFIIEKDWTYIVITSIVLIILFISPLLNYISL